MGWPFAPLLQGHYGAILADPPWRFVTRSPKGRDRCPDAPVKRAEQRQNNPERHYATMSMPEIQALPVGDLAAKDCVLFLWAVDPLIPKAIETGRKWGFVYKTPGFYWAKTRRLTSTRAELHTEPEHKLFPIGTGYWTRANPEICLLFTKGSPKRVSANVRKLIISPRREHSRKPDEQYERIQSLVAGPYCELFARSECSGWHSWGNEVGKFAEVA